MRVVNYGRKFEERIEAAALMFERVQGQDGNFNWYSSGFHGQKVISELANDKIGMVACVAGEQFCHCGKENYACAAVLPGKDYKPELVQDGNIAVVSYWMDADCTLNALVSLRGKNSG